MLPSSVRRVGAPQASPLRAILGAPTTSFGLSIKPTYQQRRRYSSSKPSSPNDSPKGLPNSGGQVAAAPATKQGGEKRRRKAVKEEQKLPSVPSTQHVPQESMALSTFFSLHRPMSVTHSFPKAITDDAFAQIFASRTRNNKQDEVISTLSRTVDNLENPMQALSLGSQDDGAMQTQNDRIQRIEVRQAADGSDSGMLVDLNAMAGQFLPFRPPPLPRDQATATPAEASSELAGAVADEAAPEHRVWKAVFTLEETTAPNGEVRIMAHSPELIEDEPAPRTFIERMAQRQMRTQEARNENDPGMIAISVKRQRKLKMKKKKYKKLQKRTRNERRKLDRL